MRRQVKLLHIFLEGKIKLLFLIQMGQYVLVSQSEG